MAVIKVWLEEITRISRQARLSSSDWLVQQIGAVVKLVPRLRYTLYRWAYLFLQIGDQILDFLGVVDGLKCYFHSGTSSRRKLECSNAK
jgi:hypothetical protein